MKETRNAMALVPLALWVIFTICALPALAAEPEMVLAESFPPQQTEQLEWLLLAVSSVWALILQIFRFKK